MYELLQASAAANPVHQNAGGSYLTMRSTGGIIFGVVRVFLPAWRLGRGWRVPWLTKLAHLRPAQRPSCSCAPPLDHDAC